MKSCEWCKMGRENPITEKIKCRVYHEEKNKYDLCEKFASRKKTKGGKKV